MGEVTLYVDIIMDGDGSDDEALDLMRAGETFEGLPRLLTEVCGHRCRQDIQWGGSAHDDTHDPADWYAVLLDHVHRAIDCMGAPAPDYPDRLLKIAAIALVARQSWDRINGTVTEGDKDEDL